MCTFVTLQTLKMVKSRDALAEKDFWGLVRRETCLPLTDCVR